MDKSLGEFLYELVETKMKETATKRWTMFPTFTWNRLRGEIKEIWNDIAKQLVLEYDRRCKEAKDNNEIPIIVMRPDNAEAKNRKPQIEYQDDKEVSPFGFCGDPKDWD